MMTKSEYEKEYTTGDKTLLLLTKFIIWVYSVMSITAFALGSDTKAVLFSLWAIGMHLIRRSCIETIHDEIDSEIANEEQEASKACLDDWHSKHMDKFKRIAKDSDIAK